ncbi:protein AF1q [Protopterus annectens]|uniref:protein AF1q n=1 Tax=Protopterus annectens TaxID=7888 RepID=UPI001CFC2C30|nr:protein AF1q [Protopterus annectens]
MLEELSSQYDSFLFWRQPIPEVDLSELEELGLGKTNHQSASSCKCPGGKQNCCDDLDEDERLSEYNEFNYWRMPVADIDSFDFSLL